MLASSQLLIAKELKLMQERISYREAQGPLTEQPKRWGCIDLHQKWRKAWTGLLQTPVLKSWKSPLQGSRKTKNPYLRTSIKSCPSIELLPGKQTLLNFHKIAYWRLQVLDKKGIASGKACAKGQTCLPCQWDSNKAYYIKTLSNSMSHQVVHTGLLLSK